MFRKIVIVTLIFSDVVPQLNITFSFKLSFERPLCCLANYFQFFLFSFQGAVSSSARAADDIDYMSRFARHVIIFQLYSQISKSNLLGSEIQQQFTVWWARVGSNHRPYDYQSYALAS